MRPLIRAPFAAALAVLVLLAAGCEKTIKEVRTPASDAALASR